MAKKSKNDRIGIYKDRSKREYTKIDRKEVKYDAERALGSGGEETKEGGLRFCREEDLILTRPNPKWRTE